MAAINSMVTELLYFYICRVVTLLCEAEAKINNGDYLGNTPLHYACSNGHIQIVKYLMQNGSNPTNRLVGTINKQSLCHTRYATQLYSINIPS